MKDRPAPQPVIERRYCPGRVELRAAGDGAAPSRTVRGYAALYGKQSDNLGSSSYRFFEVIEPGAFDDVLRDDVRALFNHDANLILARSKAGVGTLSLFVDATGLGYEFEAPATRAGDDLLESLRRGDVDQSSFAFTIAEGGQVWEERTEGDVTTVLRTIKKVGRLYDVSPVTYPAYADTTVALRSFEASRQPVPPVAPPPAPAAPETFPERSQWAARLGLD